MDSKRVIVTGGCGYLGSHTIIELLQNGFEVVSIDNFSRSLPIALENIYRVTGIRVKNFSIDLCSQKAVDTVFTELDDASALIHFAAFKSVPESVLYPEIYYRNNLVSLVNVLEAGGKIGINKFVFSSSCSVYGQIGELPVSETTPLSNVKSPYAHSKAMGEVIVGDMCRAYQMSAVLLRYFNPVGAHTSGLIGEMPRGHSDNLVPVITQTAIGKRDSMIVYGGELNTRDGSCIRDYVHVMDIACAHVLALKYLQRNKDLVEIINLGTGRGITVFEMIRTFEEVTRLKLEYRVGEPREGDVDAIYSSSEKALRLLGWEPRYSIQEMMASAWQWEMELKKNSYL